MINCSALDEFALPSRCEGRALRDFLAGLVVDKEQVAVCLPAAAAKVLNIQPYSLVEY